MVPIKSAPNLGRFFYGDSLAGGHFLNLKVQGNRGLNVDVVAKVRGFRLLIAPKASNLSAEHVVCFQIRNN